MNIYLVQRTGSIGYDETDAYVVAAPTRKAARDFGADVSGDQSASDWHARTTKVTKQGETAPSARAGIILVSFNAG